VVFGDGAVRIIPHGISRRTWSAMLGKNDGVAWKDHDLEPTTVVKRLNVGFCLRLAMFCVVVLFPIPWVWLNPTSNIASASITRAENKGQQEVDRLPNDRGNSWSSQCERSVNQAIACFTIWKRSSSGPVSRRSSPL
jgi:hypothetical protein